MLTMMFLCRETLVSEEEMKLMLSGAMMSGTIEPGEQVRPCTAALAGTGVCVSYGGAIFLMLGDYLT